MPQRKLQYHNGAKILVHIKLMVMMAAFRSHQKQYYGRFARNSRWNFIMDMTISVVRSTATRRSRWLTTRVPPRVSGQRLTGGWIPTCCSQILPNHGGRRGRRRLSERALATLHATFVVASAKYPCRRESGGKRLGGCWLSSCSGHISPTDICSCQWEC